MILVENVTKTFDENGNIYSYGLHLSVIINSEQVNTIRALQELGLP